MALPESGRRWAAAQLYLTSRSPWRQGRREPALPHPTLVVPSPHARWRPGVRAILFGAAMSIEGGRKEETDPAIARLYRQAWTTPAAFGVSGNDANFIGEKGCRRGATERPVGALSTSVCTKRLASSAELRARTSPLAILTAFALAQVQPPKPRCLELVEAVRRGIEVQDATRPNGGSDLLVRTGINLARLRVGLVLTVPERGRPGVRAILFDAAMSIRGRAKRAGVLVV